MCSYDSYDHLHYTKGKTWVGVVSGSTDRWKFASLYGVLDTAFEPLHQEKLGRLFNIDIYPFVTDTLGLYSIGRCRKIGCGCCSLVETTWTLNLLPHV
jgi:hypothetical protein